MKLFITSIRYVSGSQTLFLQGSSGCTGPLSVNTNCCKIVTKSCCVCSIINSLQALGHSWVFAGGGAAASRLDAHLVGPGRLFEDGCPLGVFAVSFLHTLTSLFLMAIMSICCRKAPSTVLFPEYLYNQLQDMRDDSALVWSLADYKCSAFVLESCRPVTS